MLEFKKLELSDISDVNPYFTLSPDRTCDNTIGGAFMWRDYFKSEYAVFDGTLIFKVVYFGGRTAFSMPTGNDVEGALDEIYAYCEENDIPAVICTATVGDMDTLRRKYQITVTQETDWSDYLYNAEDLMYFVGHRYNGQRNHMNRFKSEHPDYRYEEIKPENISDVIEFFGRFCNSEDKDSDIFREERNKVFEVLQNYAVYRQLGTILYVGDSIVAFAIGEAINDTLYEHIEKADYAYQGAYQMIASGFARMYGSDGIKYINREEDVGDAGLRASKLSYHPCMIIEKFTVTLDSVIK